MYPYIFHLPELFLESDRACPQQHIVGLYSDDSFLRHSAVNQISLTEIRHVILLTASSLLSATAAAAMHPCCDGGVAANVCGWFHREDALNKQWWLWMMEKVNVWVTGWPRDGAGWCWHWESRRCGWLRLPPAFSEACRNKAEPWERALLLLLNKEEGEQIKANNDSSRDRRGWIRHWAETPERKLVEATENKSWNQ